MPKLFSRVVALATVIVSSLAFSTIAQASIIEPGEVLTAEFPWSIEEQSLSRQLHRALALYAKNRGAFDENGNVIPSRLPASVRVDLGVRKSSFRARFTIDDGTSLVACESGRPSPQPYQIIPSAHSCRFQLQASNFNWVQGEAELASILTDALSILRSDIETNSPGLVPSVVHRSGPEGDMWRMADSESGSYIKCERRRADSAARCSIKLIP